MNKQKCTNSIKEEIIMLAKIKAFFMENIDGVAMGVEAMYGVDIHPYYNYSRSNAMTTENFTKKEPVTVR